MVIILATSNLDAIEAITISFASNIKINSVNARTIFYTPETIFINWSLCVRSTQAH